METPASSFCNLIFVMHSARTRPVCIIRKLLLFGWWLLLLRLMCGRTIFHHCRYYYISQHRSAVFEHNFNSASRTDKNLRKIWISRIAHANLRLHSNCLSVKCVHDGKNEYCCWLVIARSAMSFSFVSFQCSNDCTKDIGFTLRDDESNSFLNNICWSNQNIMRHCDTHLLIVSDSSACVFETRFNFDFDSISFCSKSTEN